MKKIGLLIALLLVLTACSDNKGNTVDTKEEVLESNETSLENTDTASENTDTALENTDTTSENTDTDSENNNEVSELSKTVLKFNNEQYKSTVTYYADGDYVHKEEVVNVINLSNNSISEDEIKEKMESQKSIYDTVPGLEYTYNFGDDGQATERLVIDYKNLDFEEFKKLGGILEGDYTKGVSLKKSIEVYKQNGYVEVE